MSVTSAVKSGHSIGLSDFNAAELTKDDSTGVTYGAVVSIPEIISINIEPNNAEANLYADDSNVDTANTLSEFNLSIELAQLPLEYRAWLLGHTFSGGKIIASATDTAPYVGISFTTLKSDGTKRYFKFTKVKFQEPNENPQTKGDQINFQTATINAKAIYRSYDKEAYEFADANEGYTDGATWNQFPAITPPSP